MFHCWSSRPGPGTVGHRDKTRLELLGVVEPVNKLATQKRES